MNGEKIKVINLDKIQFKYVMPNFIKMGETVCYSLRTYVMADKYFTQTRLRKVQIFLESLWV